MGTVVRHQLSVFLENKPGVLSRLCRSLSDAKINLVSISVSDTVDHCVIRMVVSHPEKARRIFEEHGLLVVENEVLEINIHNKPGALAEIADKLGKARVNIEYAYGTTGAGKAGNSFILRVDKISRACEILAAGSQKKSKSKTKKKKARKK